MIKDVRWVSFILIIGIIIIFIDGRIELLYNPY